MPIRMTGLNSGMDTESIITELMKAYRTKSDNIEKKQTKLGWTQEAWKDLNKKIYGFYTNISNLKYSSAYSLKKSTVSDQTKATVTASGNAVTGVQKLNVISTAQTGYLTGAKLDSSVTKDTTMNSLGIVAEETINVKSGDGTTQEIKIASTDKLGDVIDKLKEAGLNANFDNGNKRIYISAKNSGEAGDFEITASDSKVLDALGLNTAPTDPNKEAAVKLDGSDAVIKLNGVEYTNTTNSFSINGLNITATGITGDKDEDAITISTAVDSQGIYDKIKDFLTEYNDIVKEMSSLYNADSAKGYEPLTDDEKDAMSDSEIEKWETKIKDALLRKDSTLNTLMTSMSNAMSKVYEVDGKKYSLSSFGISTLSYFTAADNEKGAYHIDGDSDDANTSGNTDKLMAAINNDPEAVVDFMKQLTTGLYTAIDKQMKSTTLSSAYTIYNDKQMQKEYDNYTKVLKEWEKKISDKEDYYYKKFSAMETALGKLNSNSSYLTGMLG
ncbi:MAG: flagellar filament capping protein FliD [Agathobacter sp.]|nr:flagellar filament capping protein FliD [Agathobacter sp.]